MFVFDHSLFKFDPMSNQYSADVSDLGGYTQFADDPECWSFQMDYPDTGDSIIFTVDEVVEDDDDKIVLWVLKPSNSALRDWPKMKGVKVFIFNDAP